MSDFPATVHALPWSAPRVSVILCVRDGARFLSEALDSVLAQTLESFELIVVDDGSRDTTPSILDRCGDPRLVRLCNATPQGLTRSSNRALCVARGRYVARLDADDVAEPRRFERQVDVLDRRLDLDVLGSWTREIDGEGRTIGEHQIEPCADWIAWELARRNVVYQSTAMIRRATLCRLGGWNEDYRYAQDHELWVRILMNEGRIELLPEPLVRYRRGEHQISVRHAAEQDRLGLTIRQRYAEWLVEDTVPLLVVDGMRRLLRRDPYSETPRLDASANLVLRLHQALRSRLSGRIHERIRQLLCEAFLHHAEQALGAGDRRAAGRLFGWALKTGLRSMTHRRLWRAARQLATRPRVAHGEPLRFGTVDKQER